MYSISNQTELDFTIGGVELIDLIKPLWEKLNKHHHDTSISFKEKFKINRFEDRKKELTNYDLVRTLLIKRSNNLIGYCVSSISSNLNTGYVNSIFIEKLYRSMKLGKFLLEDAEKWFAEHNISSIYIDVVHENNEALKFYRNNGYDIYTYKLRKN